MNTLDPDKNSGRLTGKWTFTKRLFGGYNIMVECESEHLQRLFWRKVKQEELVYLSLNKTN